MIYQKALFVDMVYLQQDAFDPVDVSAPLERQQLTFPKIYHLMKREYHFPDKKAARDYFTRLTGLFKNCTIRPSTPATTRGGSAKSSWMPPCRPSIR